MTITLTHSSVTPTFSSNTVVLCHVLSLFPGLCPIYTEEWEMEVNTFVLPWFCCLSFVLVKYRVIFASQPLLPFFGIRAPWKYSWSYPNIEGFFSEMTSGAILISRVPLAEPWDKVEWPLLTLVQWKQNWLVSFGVFPLMA